MKVSTRLISFSMIAILLFSTLCPGLVVSAEENLYVSVTFDKLEFAVGETYTPTIVKSSPDLTLLWSVNSAETPIVSVSESGQVTALSVGSAKITVRCQNPDSSYPGDYIYSRNFIVNVYDSLGIESGLSYYIMNAESQRLMSSASTNPVDYANVVTSQRLWQAKSRWQAVEQADGLFKLLAFAGSSVGILEANGTNIEIETDDNGSAEKFRIMRVDEGSKKGLYLITNGSSYVTQGTDEMQDDVYLAATPNDFSYWSFMKVEKGYAEFFGFDYSGFNTSIDSSEYNEMAYNYGYGTCGHVNSTVSLFMSELCLEDLMMYSGHGHIGMLSFTDANGAYAEVLANDRLASSSGSYPSESIEELEYNELSSMRCVMYMSCLSGCGSGNNNLVNVTYDKGAHFVFGITVSISSSSCAEWTQHFWNAIDDGRNIIGAITYADSRMDDIGYYPDESGVRVSVGDMPAYYVGDSLQYISIG